MFINFSDIPGHSNLFLDYLYEFNNLNDFYKMNFRDKDEYLKHFKAICEASGEFRSELSKILIEQYSKSTLSDTTRNNITLLASKNSLAVVTGQQLGILGGPLYTVYKVISAIKLSKYLSERYDEFNFIPVFWLEGDDHDFEEVSSFSIINENNEIEKITYAEEIPEDGNKGSVGYLKFTESINDALASLEQHLRKTEFTDDIISKLKSIYKPGNTFKESFKELLIWLFDEYGLVILDPQDKKIKDLLRPVFKQEITDFRKHSEKLIQASAVLEEMYHAQVKVRAINLFYNFEEGRYLVEPVDNEYRLRRKRKRFTFEELINMVETEPENFSPNVLLRPICQDYLLPTAFYVAGPGEIAYFAQAAPLYDFYSINEPVIYPRSSVTILEKTISTLLEKNNLELKDVYYYGGDLKGKMIGNASDNITDEIFKNAEDQFELAMDQLKEKLFEIDKTISDSSTKYKQKIFQYLNELKSKTEEAQNKKYEVTIRQAERITASIFPNNNLQEREINFIYFLNKYGIGLLKQLLEETEINKFEHQVIRL